MSVEPEVAGDYWVEVSIPFRDRQSDTAVALRDAVEREVLTALGVEADGSGRDIGAEGECDVTFTVASDEEAESLRICAQAASDGQARVTVTRAV